MAERPSLPKLITFDGEARSGKGTIVQATKDALRDDYGFKVMLIDAGQVFRCLVVAASNRGVNLDDPAAIDEFLADDKSAESCVQFVKAVYHMEKIDRDAMLYTNQVGADSAKVGARPLSQAFKDELLKKWLRDAREEGFEIVLLDGRALEETGQMLEDEGLCEFIIGLYFVCDAEVGALRTLGHASRNYADLTEDQRADVDLLVTQINARNQADRERAVQPIIRPNGAPIFTLPNIPATEPDGSRFMATVDTSAEMSKDEMCQPVIKLVVALLAPATLQI
jgi:cytidylate kinase